MVIRGRDAPIRLLAPPEEVFGRNQLRLRPVEFRPLDHLGRACLHCRKPLAELADLTICVRDGAPVAALHERCFKRWFVVQDKPALGAYRFGYVETVRLRPGDGVTRFLLPGERLVADHEFEAVRPLDYNQLAEPGIEAEAAYVRAAEADPDPGAAPGATSDVNILMCPHCDHPNQVPFLKTEGAHRCARCGGRYGVKVVRL